MMMQAVVSIPFYVQKVLELCCTCRASFAAATTVSNMHTEGRGCIIAEHALSAPVIATVQAMEDNLHRPAQLWHN